MNIEQAKAECQRWLDYLQKQKENTIAVQQIAAGRRNGSILKEEALRRLQVIDNKSSLTVYDGSKLAEAVKLLIAKV